jgi:hypothetical protein
MKTLLLLIILVFNGAFAFSQDLLAMLDEESDPPVNYVQSTFKSVRMVNGYSSEVAGKNDLIFSISHRFGPVSGGAYELYGLDQSTIRFGFEYGLNDRISLGVGRSNYEKLFDGFVKIKLLRQKNGASSFPVSVTLMEGMQYKSLKWVNRELDYPETARLSYVHELFIARKFNKWFSAQLVPVIVHRNWVTDKEEQNIVGAVGIGGVFTVNKWLGINAEYYHLLPGHTADNFENSLALGVEIETGGGHVFQIHLSNSTGMTEKNFVPENTGSWLDGDIALGFNLIRVFNLDKKTNIKERKN